MMKILNRIFALLCLCSVGLAENSQPSTSLDPELLARWQDVSEMSIGPRNQNFIQEGPCHRPEAV